MLSKQMVISKQDIVVDVTPKIMKFLVIILGVFNNGCSLFSASKIQQAAVLVSIENQDRIRFTGKGAGAGMMMSASMGAMGIAIGVAIDEGIAKEIHESFIASGNNFSEIIKAETNNWLSSAFALKRERRKNSCAARIQA